MTDNSLKARLQNDIKEAMRARDQQRLDALRFALSVIKQKEVDDRITVDDSQVLSILEKLIKQRKEAIDQFKKAARNDLVKKETWELNLLQSYLPEPLSEPEITRLIQETIKTVEAVSVRDMGKVMAALKPQIQGRADGAKVSHLVKTLLS